MPNLHLEYYSGSDLYSDGDIEDVILDIVKKNEDFTEILSSTDSWPILYHLTPMRLNLIEWYDFNPSGNLLEIGGGCGAFSGYFSKKLREVSVVELSRRRAEIIMNRHSQCGNMDIYVGNFYDIKFNKKYDYITLIGVLEYAGKFTPTEQPYLDFLKCVKSLLNEGGKLIIAIENKFGLKYFAGAGEDHTGRMFDSIEGYPLDGSVSTFGRVELEELILSAGFSKTEFYYPVPDYKIPKTIYSDNYLPDADSLFDLYSPNYDQERDLLFSEKDAMSEIIKNNNFKFFANSFLVEAKL